MQKILFVIDRIELKYFEFNDLVTNFWLIKEFLKRNYDVFITTIDNLGIQDSIAVAKSAKTHIKNEDIKHTKNWEQIPINDFNMVLFRPDPPVDMDYISATYVFDFVDEENETEFIYQCFDVNEKIVEKTLKILLK